MPSFPQMRDLPPVLDATGWRWERYASPSCPSDGFWLGRDTNGNRWLTKLRGSFYAYREIVFDRLAQKMGWSCQSSAFLQLDALSANTLGIDGREIQDLHWFLDEHAPAACSGDCPLDLLCGRSIDSVDDLPVSKFQHLLDWPKSDFAACLFGANDSPGLLITSAHELVIIDSEQMFLTGPVRLDGAAWWNMRDGSPSPSGRKLAREVCQDLCGLSAADIKDALSIPKGISIDKNWPIAPKLKASRLFAADFLRRTLQL
ncbi:hypothetical protein QF000_006656 [Paraburkholderia atlantica]